jgi:cell division septation protein DedD
MPPQQMPPQQMAVPQPLPQPRPVPVPVPLPPPRASAPVMPNPSGNGAYRIQVGAFTNTGFAQQCFNRLVSAGFTPYYEQSGNVYRVVIVGVRSADIALVVQRLEVAGFPDVWIREEK